MTKIATGEYWYGLQALDLKLIDDIKTSDDYLIEKSKDHDVYSIEYKIHESLKEKISNVLSKTTHHILEKLTHKTILT